jgi:hypothetical protein
MALSDRDYRLSMFTSRRAREEGRNDGLRSLLVHRLRDASKAVLRIPLKRNLAKADDASDYSVYCEPCDAWFVLDDWGEEVRHKKCGRLYALEFAVFSLVEEPPKK